MDSIYVLIPVTFVLLGFALGAYLWSVSSGQFDDLEKAAQKLSVNDVLLKPVRPDWICQLIASAIAHLTGQVGARPSAPPQNKHTSG